MKGQQNAYQYPEVPPVPENRFSFMPAQIEPESRNYQQDVPAYTAAPPLPPLPYYPDQRREARYQMEAAPQQIIQNKTQENIANINTQHVHTTQQPDLTLQTKQDVPHRPDPIKIMTQVHRSRLSIGPDENPLSPSTAPYTPIWTPKTTNMIIIPPSNRNTLESTYTPATPAPQQTHGGTWTHSLCSCAEPSTCLTSLFCPCTVYSRTQYKLSQRSEKKDPTNMLGYNSINGSCLAWSLLCGINGILSGIQRGRVRRTYEMDSGSGNFFDDCIRGCCCCCCVLAQSEKEIKVREESCRKLGATTSGKNEGYVPPGGMVFSPIRDKN